MNKAPDAFRTISEVADDLDIPQHVLRFWESRFPQIKPMKRAGGRRYYRPDDVDLLRGIRHLLYGEGYTIRGVQRILRDQGQRFVQAVWTEGAAQPAPDAHLPGELDEAEDLVADGVPDRAADSQSPELAFDAPMRMREPNLDFGRPVPMPPPREMAIAEPQMPRGLSSHHAEQLQAALDELIACRQLIDQAITDDQV